MKSKDVRGSFPSRTGLQDILIAEDKDNVSLHKDIDDLVCL